jgi:hypothetical protein
MPQTDKLIRKVELKIDGRLWPIVVDHELLIELEDLTGLNVLTGQVNLSKPSARLLRDFLYLALKRAGANYSQKDVSGRINPGNIIRIQEALLAAWSASMPEPEPEPPENPTPAAGA